MNETDNPLTVDPALVRTGEVVYVDIYDTTGETRHLRILLAQPVDARNDGGITYSKVVEAVDSAYLIGADGTMQLPHDPLGQEFSSMFFALVANLVSVTIHPPVIEELDNGND